MEYNTRIDLITFLIENIIEIYDNVDNLIFTKILEVQNWIHSRFYKHPFVILLCCVFDLINLCKSTYNSLYLVYHHYYNYCYLHIQWIQASNYIPDCTEPNYMSLLSVIINRQSGATIQLNDLWPAHSDKQR